MEWKLHYFIPILAIVFANFTSNGDTFEMLVDRCNLYIYFKFVEPHKIRGIVV